MGMWRELKMTSAKHSIMITLETMLVPKTYPVWWSVVQRQQLNISGSSRIKSFDLLFL